MADKRIFCLVLAMALISGIGITNVYAQSTNYVPQLVGTWTDQDNTRVVFNADGTGSWGRDAFKFAAIGNTMVVIYNIAMNNFSYEFILSDDGKTLLITHMRHNGIMMGWILRR